MVLRHVSSLSDSATRHIYIITGNIGVLGGLAPVSGSHQLGSRFMAVSSNWGYFSGSAACLR